MKLCKDCLWCRPSIKTVGIFAPKEIKSYGSARCAHESTFSHNTGILVDGEPRISCEHWRGDWDNMKDSCGSEGEYWEQRK